MITFSKYFVSLLGIGFFPIAPGTISSIFTIIIWYIFVDFFNVLYFYIFFLIILFLSFRITSLYLKQCKEKDPPEVVIDEFLGQSIPLLFIIEYNLLELLIAFLSFRFFDIFKVFPINKAEKIDGSTGVLLDDIIAGVYALIVIILFRIFIAMQ